MDSSNRSEENQKHSFKILPMGTPLPPLAQITSVSVVPFTKEGFVVATLNHRGTDIPGGHIDPPDKSVLAAARRETKEEICTRMNSLVLACVIESTMLRNGKPTYMVILTGRVDTFDELKFAKDEKSFGRKITTPEFFIEEFGGGMGKAFMRDIIQRACEVYAATYVSPPARIETRGGQIPFPQLRAA